MAYHSGTIAAGGTGNGTHNALLDEFVTFLSTAGWGGVNGVALPAGQEWALERNTVNADVVEVIFRGQGNDSVQNIYAGVQTYQNVGANTYNWQLLGATGYAAGSDYLDQPGVQLIGGLKPVCDASFWNGVVDFWMSADGQAAWCLAKVSTIYTLCGFGYGNVQGPPSTYSYPLFWAGTSPGFVRDGIQQQFNVVSNRHRNVLDPVQGSAFIRWVDGNMYLLANNDEDGSGTPTEPNFFEMWPSNRVDTNSQEGTLFGLASDFPAFIANVQPINGVRPGFPLVAFSLPSRLNSYAFRMPRILSIPANGLAPESTVTIDGNTYRVFPNINRIGNANYIGLLEA